MWNERDVARRHALVDALCARDIASSDEAAAISEVDPPSTAGSRTFHRTDRSRHVAVGAARVRAHPSNLRVGYGRRNDGPAMSVVYYVPTDNDALLVSTMAGRSKALAVARDPKVSLCVLDERWPFTHLHVYADATVDREPDLVVDVMMAVGERMSGQPMGADARPIMQAMAEQEQRVVVRCRSYSTFAQPPRHLHDNDQAERLTHWISGSIPWDALDPS
jgi:hypothetical protein